MVCWMGYWGNGGMGPLAEPWMAFVLFVFGTKNLSLCLSGTIVFNTFVQECLFHHRRLRRFSMGLYVVDDSVDIYFYQHSHR